MGRVVPFASGYRVAASEEATSLLAKLSGSLDYMWKGGWAELTPTGAIAVIHHGHCLGLWVHRADGFTFYRTSGEQGALLMAPSIDEAYRQSLIIVGGLCGSTERDG
jgi:hypothetical protein